MTERYKTVCCKCGNIFYASKSLAQQFGLNDSGCGSCPKCKTFLNLTYDPDENEMKTKAWNDYIKIK